MMGMQHHPGFQHVRHGTPQSSPPMHNGAMPQFQRGPSPLPPGISRPSSRQSQHQGHIRRTSSNLVPPQHQQHAQGPYAYTPNPPFYQPQNAAPMQQRPPGAPPHPQQATYPPPYPPQGAQHPQMQQVMMQDNRRSSMPPAFPQQPPPQANMQRNPSQEHLQPPQQPQQQPQPHPSPRPQQQQQQQQGRRPTPSPQPPQQAFASPPMPQPKPLPAHAKSHSIFTPIDDSRSMLARNWGSTSNAPEPRSDPTIKVEEGGPRSQSIDVAAMQREKEAAAAGAGPGRPNGVSPRPPPARAPQRPPQPPQRTESAPGVPNIRAPTRSNTNQSDAKRPRLKVQIPSEQSGDEGDSAQQDDTSTSQPANTAQGQPPPGPSHGVVLPPPSPSASALLSAGAQGPPNPFARPAPPMSTNPHAMNRETAAETPISALPSRFMSDNLLPSPSTFYPEWGFGRSADSNMLPSPLNFQTPVVANGAGWREEDRKRAAEEAAGGEGDGKRART